MAGVPITLAELIDSATNVHNRESNDVYAGYVSKQVNKEVEGPYTAAKLLVEKLQLRQEIVSLQTLNVIERCVKDCGAKFHQEIGKYKFINELIKLLSPKYDGDTTPQAVKDRIIELMFSWYVGLPNEKKIGEAYKMLKQQGIVKRDPIDITKPSELPKYNEKTVFSDEGNSELLKTLLSSKNPDDLQSANKLIKSLVKEEEARLERVSKRIHDLELVSNNVKLLDDMLSHYNLATPQPELDLIKELYESCLQMRPELFRLASNSVQDKDDSMAEILSASDELTRVIDSYKEKVLLQAVEGGLTKPYNISTASPKDSPKDSLLDLEYDSKIIQPSSEISGNSLLDEQFKMLGLDITESTLNQNPIQGSSNTNFYSNVPYYQPVTTQSNYGIQQVLQQQLLNSYHQQTVQQQLLNHQQTVQQQLLNHQQTVPNIRNQPPYYYPSSAVSTNNMANIGFIRNAPVVATPIKVEESTKGLSNELKNKSTNDLFDFDVFSEFRDPKVKSKLEEQNFDLLDKIDGANQSAIDHLLDIEVPQNLSVTTDKDILCETFPDKNNSFIINPNHNNLPVSQNFDEMQISSEVTSNRLSTTSTMDSLSSSSQTNYLVPLETLKPTGHAPIVILDKDGLKTFLNIVSDTRESANPNVLVFILSTVSTSTHPTNNFSIQVAVPKVMRVKLQPATSTELPAFNPILPPPTITQIMLIANPTKEEVRLRFKIIYTIHGISSIENFSIDELAVR